MAQFKLLGGTDDITYLEVGLDLSIPGSVTDLKVTGIDGSPNLLTIGSDGEHYVDSGDSTTTDKLTLTNTFGSLIIEATDSEGCYILSDRDVVFSGMYRTPSLLHLKPTRFGFGREPTSATLEIEAGTLDGFYLENTNPSGLPTFTLYNNSAGYTNKLIAEQSRGTLSAPAVLASGDIMFSFNLEVYSNAYYKRGAVEILADGAFSASSSPGAINLRTGDSAMTRGVTIRHDGKIGIDQVNPEGMLHIGQTSGCIFNIVGDIAHISWNAIYDGSWSRLNDAQEAAILQLDHSTGEFKMFMVPSGSGSFTPSYGMALAVNKNVGFGKITSSPGVAFDYQRSSGGTGGEEKVFSLRHNTYWGLFVTEDTTGTLKYKIGSTYNLVDYPDNLVMDSNMVGIGGDPATWLHIYAQSNNILTRWISANTSYYLSLYSEEISGVTAWNFKPTVSPTEFAGLKIHGDGKIGIGLPDGVAPNCELDIKGTMRITTDLDGTSGLYLYANRTTAETFTRIFFDETDYGDNYGFSIVYNGGNNNHILNYAVNTFGISVHNNNATGYICMLMERDTDRIGLNYTAQDKNFAINSTGPEILILEGSTYAYIDFYWQSGPLAPRDAYMGVTSEGLVINNETGGWLQLYNAAALWESTHTRINSASIPTCTLDITGAMHANNYDMGYDNVYGGTLNISAASYAGPYRIYFNKSFSAPPKTIICTLMGASTNYIGWVSIHINYTATSSYFDIYLMNLRSVGISIGFPYVSWVAFWNPF